MTTNAWQRLPPAAMFYLFLRGSLKVARENLPLLLGAGAGVALFDAFGLRELGLLLGLLLLFGLLLALIYHRRFRFRVDDDQLLVRKGILERSELKVRSGQIQQVTLEAPWHLRLFGLVRFGVDTAGGAGTEVELPGITPQMAAALRSRLEHAQVATESGPDAAPPVLHEATTSALIRHGLANNHAWVALAAMTPFLHRLGRVLSERLAEWPLPTRLEALLERPLLALPLAVLLLLLALMLASVIIALLRYHGFRLSRELGPDGRRRLRQHSGWLSRREQVLQSGRLQVVEQVQTPVGRLLGSSHLIARQIGTIQSDPVADAQVFQIPALPPDAAARLLPVLWPGLPPAGPMQRVHRHFRRLSAIRFGLMVLLPLVFLAQQSADPRWLLPLIALLPAAALAAHLRWLGVGYEVQGQWLRIRFGLLGRRTTIFPASHVHRAAVQQNFLQRRRGVADLVLLLANGPITLPCLPEATAFSLLDTVLTQVATTPLPAPVAAAS